MASATGCAALSSAALDAAAAEAPLSEASLRRLLTLARYGARIDGDIGRALRALRSLRDRPDEKIADAPACTPEPQAPPAAAAAPEPTRFAARTSEPDIPVPPGAAVPASPAAQRHQRRRLEALQRQEQRRAAGLAVLRPAVR